MKDMEDMRSYAKEVTADLTGINNRTTAKVKPMKSLGSLLVNKERHTFGLPFWDDNGGNFAGGEIHGLLGPTGGGKTVIGIGVACAQAKMHRHVIYVTYEQEIAR